MEELKRDLINYLIDFIPTKDLISLRATSKIFNKYLICLKPKTIDEIYGKHIFYLDVSEISKLPESSTYVLPKNLRYIKIYDYNVLHHLSIPLTLTNINVRSMDFGLESYSLLNVKNIYISTLNYCDDDDTERIIDFENLNRLKKVFFDNFLDEDEEYIKDYFVLPPKASLKFIYDN